MGNSFKAPTAPIEKIADAIMEGASASNLENEFGIGQSLAKSIGPASKMVLAEFQEHFRAKLQKVIDKATDMIEEKLEAGEGSLGQLTMIVGVGADKIRDMGSKAPNSVHLHLHGTDRAKLVGGMLGADARRAEPALISAQPAQQTQTLAAEDQAPHAIDLQEIKYAALATPKDPPSD